MSLSVRKREMIAAGVTENSLREAQMWFEQWGLRLNRYYRGTQKAGWYVHAIRSGQTDGTVIATWMAVDLAQAIDSPEAIRAEWIDGAKQDRCMKLDPVDHQCPEDDAE